MSLNDPFQEQIATYALGALEGEDRQQLEAHLKRCARCRAALHETRSIVNLLPRGVEPVPPSAETRHKLFARIHDDLARTHSAAHPLHLAGWFIPLLAIGLTMLVGFLALPFITQTNQEREIADIMNDPNAQAHPLVGTQGATGARGRLVMAPDANKAVLVVTGLTPLASDKTYEFWLGHKDQMIPAGLFQVDSNGGTMLLVLSAETISAFDWYCVSVEQKAGAQVPNGPIILQYGYPY
ncbi:MAG: anti-sigma factor [Anaerolineae bacterium]